jgi:hypothetical protein
MSSIISAEARQGNGGVNRPRREIETGACFRPHVLRGFTRGRLFLYAAEEVGAFDFSA